MALAYVNHSQHAAFFFFSFSPLSPQQRWKSTLPERSIMWMHSLGKLAIITLESGTPGCPWPPLSYSPGAGLRWQQQTRCRKCLVAMDHTLQSSINSDHNSLLSECMNGDFFSSCAGHRDALWIQRERIKSVIYSSSHLQAAAINRLKCIAPTHHNPVYIQYYIEHCIEESTQKMHIYVNTDWVLARTLFALNLELHTSPGPTT